MRLHELLDGIETRTGYTLNPEISNVTDDSRNVRKSSAFVCIKGHKHDGHDYAKKALEKGIKAVVFDRGGYIYHGRVAALAEGAREGGLEFQ